LEELNEEVNVEIVCYDQRIHHKHDENQDIQMFHREVRLANVQKEI